MEQKATFRYFYGEEADMHSFYRIPKLLFTNDYFKALSNDAKNSLWSDAGSNVLIREKSVV